MSKKFILYKYDSKENSLKYVKYITASSVEYTPNSTNAKRYNGFIVFFLAVIYNFTWINEKYTVL